MFEFGHQLLSAETIGIGEQYGKFITTQARGGVGLANCGSQYAAHRLKGLIPFGMTMGIVDRLEIVQVQVSQGNRTTPTLSQREVVAKPLFEGATSVQTGEAVCSCELPFAQQAFSKCAE